MKPRMLWFFCVVTVGAFILGSQAMGSYQTGIYHQDSYNPASQSMPIEIYQSARSGDFPVGPDPELTPGTLCDHADSYRYPEHIPYCVRDVDTSLKKDIIATYDRERGFQVQKMPRVKFKIDHYIPLCMGGGNDRANLWPQHESVYTKTDKIEQILCEKMAAGKIIQKNAIELIRKAKNDLSLAEEVEDIARHL